MINQITLSVVASAHVLICRRRMRPNVETTLLKFVIPGGVVRFGLGVCYPNQLALHCHCKIERIYM